MQHQSRFSSHHLTEVKPIKSLIPQSAFCINSRSISACNWHSISRLQLKVQSHLATLCEFFITRWMTESFPNFAVQEHSLCILQSQHSPLINTFQFSEVNKKSREIKTFLAFKVGLLAKVQPIPNSIWIFSATLIQSDFTKKLGAVYDLTSSIADRLRTAMRSEEGKTQCNKRRGKGTRRRARRRSIKNVLQTK